MCVAFEAKNGTFKSGAEVDAVGPSGLVRNVWAGFARSEILEWWVGKGGVLLDIPARRFAERSDVTGRLAWENIPEQLVIRGLLDTRSKHPLIKVVTRASDPEELTRFEHPRMPVIELPSFPNIDPPPRAVDQAELF